MNVVVTGMGAVTPLGGTLAGSWEALMAGRDAEGPLDFFETEGCRTRRAASAVLPALEDVAAKALRRLSRGSRLAIPAAREALFSAGLLDAAGRSLLPGLSISGATTGGGMAFGEAFVRALALRTGRRGTCNVFRYLPHQQMLDVQRALGVAGPSLTIANACASGANAIGHGADLILSGEAECVLAGGFDALSELIFAGFDSLQATTTERCRPFDLNRSGLLLGEGAAFLVLESEAHAARRGAPPLCRLSGYGHATDFFHLTQPHPEGTALVGAMRRAASHAGIGPAEIGYVNAHGTATPLNDGIEAVAYGAFFNGALGQTRISSTKAAIGHALGAAGAVEACFTIMALRTGGLPPQLNLQTPIPGIAEVLVPLNAPPRRLAHAMSVNLGFGGSNAALIFSRS